MKLFKEKTEGTFMQSKRSWRLPRLAALAAALVLTTGVVATQTFAGNWGGPGSWRHGGFMSGSVTQADAEKRIRRAVRHLAIEIDATLEQQDQMIGIFSAAARDLLPVREQIRATRQAARTLLTQTTIDRAAIEAHRSKQVERLDQVSKRLAAAFADAAEVLTPAQRSRLSELMP